MCRVGLLRNGMHWNHDLAGREQRLEIPHPPGNIISAESTLHRGPGHRCSHSRVSVGSTAPPEPTPCTMSSPRRLTGLGLGAP